MLSNECKDTKKSNKAPLQNQNILSMVLNFALTESLIEPFTE